MENSKMQPQDYDSIYEYLEALDILEYGSHESIQSARDYYWACYRKTYKKEVFTKNNKSVSISFSLKEYNQFKKKAQDKNLPISRCIKEHISLDHVDLTELEFLLVSLIVELESESIPQDIIIERLEVLLRQLQSK